MYLFIISVRPSRADHQGADPGAEQTLLALLLAEPRVEEKGGKVSMVSHSLGCVIAFDIMTGWDPVRFCLQEHQAMEEELALRWISYEEKDLMEQLQSTRTR